MATDPMFKLDHMGDDVKKMKDLQPVMDNLEKFQRRKKDDYELNSLLRRKFRVRHFLRRGIFRSESRFLASILIVRRL